MMMSTEFVSKLYRFSAVGILATFVYYVVLWTLVEGARVPVMASTSIAFLIVVIENYILHYWWTFRSDVPHTTAIRRFVFMNMGGFILNWSIMFLGVRHFRLNYLWVQAVAIAVVVVWNFVLSNFWIFFHANRMKHAARERGY